MVIEQAARATHLIVTSSWLLQFESSASFVPAVAHANETVDVIFLILGALSPVVPNSEIFAYGQCRSAAEGKSEEYDADCVVVVARHTTVGVAVSKFVLATATPYRFGLTHVVESRRDE